MFQIAQDAAQGAQRQRLTIADAHRVRRNPGVFDAATEAEAQEVIRAEIYEAYELDMQKSSAEATAAEILQPSDQATQPVWFDFWFWIMAGLVGIGSIVAAHYVLAAALYLTRG